MENNKLVDTNVVTKDWVDLKLQASLSDYAKRSELETIRRDIQSLFEKVALKLDWRWYLGTITTIAIGLLTVIFKSFS